MLLTVTFTLGQLLDCQLDIATQLSGKPHQFQLFRLLGRVGVVLFGRDFGGIDRRLRSAETIHTSLYLRDGLLAMLMERICARSLSVRPSRDWISSNLLTYFRWSNKILQSLLLMMVPLTMGDEMMSSTSWVTTTASPKNFRTVLSRLSTRRLIIFLWQVSKCSPPNRTYTSQRIRLSTNFSLSFRHVSSYDNSCTLQSSCVCGQSCVVPSFPFPASSLVSLHGA